MVRYSISRGTNEESPSKNMGSCTKQARGRLVLRRARRAGHQVGAHMSTPVVQAIRSAILGVALAALVGVTSGQVKSAAKVMTLTPMDYVEIRQLVNRYAFALDT